MIISNRTYTKKKQIRKIASVIIQVIILIVLGFVCIKSFFILETYEPYAPENTKFSGDKGFIALAYFGIDKTGKQNLIREERLREHLEALKNLGYVTITQQDILDYYLAKKELPEKSLFLFFEDGRTDTAVFAEKILEDLNFKATMLTYAEKFEKKDPKFLSPQDLISLEKNSFWEMGTNGYRLAFINVFDRHDNYLGEMDSLKHSEVAAYLGRRYNHYLMDYIRDEYGVPKESYNRMKERISYDYETLRDSYTKQLGYVPQMYALMHSNTGSFGNNDRVSAVNAYWLKELFKMNFNREGLCFNQRNSSIYDLTRMQPQSYWHTNHLLMRIKYATNQDLEFVKGNLDKQENWEMLTGASEIQDETIILTSLPHDRGLMRLKNNDNFENLKLSVRLKGNKVGLQKIYLRANENLNNYLSVYLLNNVLYVAEKTNDVEKELFKLNLDKHDGLARRSIAEDKKAAEIRELETFLKYSESVERAKIYSELLKNKNLETALTTAAGAEEYIPALSMHAEGNRLLEISLKEDKISIRLDGKNAIENLRITVGNAGSIYLESAYGNYGLNQINLTDSVYDGVFEKLIITENTGAKEENILFDSRLQGFDAVLLKAKKIGESILNWSVKNF